MKLSQVFSVGLVAVCLVSCAKKKDAPPRANLVGKVVLAEKLAEHLNKKNNFKTENYCFQAVQLNDASKTEVIEISKGNCPADGVAESVVATMKIWGSMDPESTLEESYLVMGDSSVGIENTPVGIFAVKKAKKDANNAAKKVTAAAVITPKDEKSDKKSDLEITHLCTSASGGTRLDVSEYCRIVTDKDGNLEKIDFDSAMTIDRAMLSQGLDAATKIESLSKGLALAQENTETPKVVNKFMLNSAELTTRIKNVVSTKTFLTKPTDARVAIAEIKGRSVIFNEVSDIFGESKTLAKNLEAYEKSLDGMVRAIPASTPRRKDVSKAIMTFSAAAEKTITALKTVQIDCTVSHIQSLEAQIEEAKENQKLLERLTPKLKAARDQLANLNGKPKTAK